MQKMTKNSTELGRTFATLMMDMGFRHSLMEVTSAEEFKQLMRERAQKLAKHQALPEHRRSTMVVESVFDEPEGVSGNRKDKTVYLVFLFVCFVLFLPSTSLWGVYSETFIHRYNIHLTHAFTRLCMIFFPHMYGSTLLKVTRSLSEQKLCWSCVAN